MITVVAMDVRHNYTVGIMIAVVVKLWSDRYTV